MDKVKKNLLKHTNEQLVKQNKQLIKKIKRISTLSGSNVNINESHTDIKLTTKSKTEDHNDLLGSFLKKKTTIKKNRTSDIC